MNCYFGLKWLENFWKSFLKKSNLPGGWGELHFDGVIFLHFLWVALYFFLLFPDYGIMFLINARRGAASHIAVKLGYMYHARKQDKKQKKHFSFQVEAVRKQPRNLPYTLQIKQNKTKVFMKWGRSFRSVLIQSATYMDPIIVSMMIS